MKNILIALIPAIVITIACLIIIIPLAIKHTKTTIGWMIVLIICIIGLICFNIPSIRDLTNFQLETFEGEYYGYAGSNSINFSDKLYFKDEEENITIYVPPTRYSNYKLKKGKKYKIRYAKHSHIIYDAILIDE